MCLNLQLIDTVIIILVRRLRFLTDVDHDYAIIIPCPPGRLASSSVRVQSGTYPTRGLGDR